MYGRQVIVNYAKRFIAPMLVSKYVINEDLGIIHGCDLFMISSEMHHIS